MSLNNHIARELLEELRQLIQDREALRSEPRFPASEHDAVLHPNDKAVLGRFRLDFIVGLLPLDQVTNFALHFALGLQRPARLYFVKSRENLALAGQELGVEITKVFLTVAKGILHRASHILELDDIHVGK